MKILNKQVSLPLIKVILSATVLIIVILGYLYFNYEAKFEKEMNLKVNSLIGGILAGIIVALMQLLLSWYEFMAIEKFKKMQILEVLSNRDDRSFYTRLIEQTNKKIDVMGVTADRFIEHFADISGNQERSKVLLKAMSDRNVSVRLLLPNVKHLKNANLKRKFQSVKDNLELIKQDYPNFSFKYFDHIPQHSIFVLDDQCLLGPVFPDVSSKDTPAVFLKNESPFAKKYLEYFEKEWNQC